MIMIGVTQRVEETPSDGERRDCLDQAWTSLLLTNGFLPVPLPNRIAIREGVEALIESLGLGGVILSGGNDLATLPGARNTAPERDTFETLLLDVCGERRLPVLGVCRGLQKLVSDAGGVPVPVKGHAGTAHRIRCTRPSAMPLGDQGDERQVNSYHDFGLEVDSLGEQLEPVALADDGSVEAVVHTDLPFWGIMWHPERGLRDERDAAILRAHFDASRS